MEVLVPVFLLFYSTYTWAYILKERDNIFRAPRAKVGIAGVSASSLAAILFALVPLRFWMLGGREVGDMPTAWLLLATFVFALIGVVTSCFATGRVRVHGVAGSLAPLVVSATVGLVAP